MGRHCKPFAVRLSKEQKEFLTVIANREERSVGAVIRRAINEYVKKRGFELQEKSIQEVQHSKPRVL